MGFASCPPLSPHSPLLLSSPILKTMRSARKPTKPRARHSIRNRRVKRKLSTPRGTEEFILVFIPPEPSANVVADGNRSLNPTRPSVPNQEKRSVSLEEERVAMNKFLEKVRARLRFLESVKQNAESSSNQGGVLISSSPAVVGDAAPADQC